jgi:hypothetical protein
MTDVDSTTGLEALNDSVLKLQRSARRTLPMFAIGILATVIAAAVAVYYIVTLSADLHVARAALADSQLALADARANLGTANAALVQAQKSVTSPANAGSIAAAISEVSRSQSNIGAAASAITDASSKLAPGISDDASGVRQMAGKCRLAVNSATYLNGECEIEMMKGGSFRIFTVGRAGVSATVTRQGRLGIGSWQSAPDHQAVALGTLQRSGACWSNDSATVCAWNGG